MDKNDTIGVGTCFCRHAARLMDEDTHDMPMEVCMWFGNMAAYAIEMLGARPMTKPEALQVLDKAEEAGLVHMSRNTTEEIDFICNCDRWHCGVISGVLKRRDDMISATECGIWDKEGSCLIPLALLETLSVYHRKTITSDYLDIMGHMNIRWYFELFARSGRKLFTSHGLDENYFRGGNFGVFTLKQFIQYFAEVLVGQTVAIHTRLIGRSDKRFHFMHFMINETTSQLAATFEALITHADLKIRRAAPMPAGIAQKLDATLAKDKALDWEAPICGAMRL